MNVLDRIENGKTTVSVGIDNTNQTPEQIADSKELLCLARRGARYRWIPVSERLPEIDYTKPPYYRYVKTIGRDKNGDCGELRYRSNGYAKTEKGRLPRWELPNGRKYDGKVTHWMPLPEPEEEG